MKSNHLIRYIEASLDEGSRFEVGSLTQNAGYSKTLGHIELKGKGAHAEINAVTLTKNKHRNDHQMKILLLY